MSCLGKGAWHFFFSTFSIITFTIISHFTQGFDYLGWEGDVMADVDNTTLSSSAIISSYKILISNQIRIFCLLFSIQCSKSSETVKGTRIVDFISFHLSCDINSAQLKSSTQAELPVLHADLPVVSSKLNGNQNQYLNI